MVASIDYLSLNETKALLNEINEPRDRALATSRLG